MAKKPTVTTISSGFASNTQLNANFTAIRDAFDNTLSLDGSTPNAMQADLDLNGNDLLNAGSLATDSLVLNGQTVTPSDLSSVPEWRSSWLTAQDYFKNDLVTTNGNVYICLVSHTSSVFATDLAAARWELFIQRGDLLAANNLSDLTNPSTARTNLGFTLTNLGVTATASEINALDGVTASTAELNILDGVTATTAQLNATANGFFLGDVDYLTSGTAATYTTPTGARALRVTCVGAGGGGGGVDGQGAVTTAHGRAGGGGGVCVKFITSPAASYTYTIGAGGTGGATGANAGSAGGNTTFADGVSLTLTANGGAAGAGHLGTSGNNFGSGALGGSATGGDLNLNGVAAGGFNVVGGVLASYSDSGFAPGFGGNVHQTSTSGDNGVNGVTFGSGGSGAISIGVATNYAGGDGADGLIIVEVFF